MRDQLPYDPVKVVSLTIPSGKSGPFGISIGPSSKPEEVVRHAMSLGVAATVLLQNGQKIIVKPLQK